MDEDLDFQAFREIWAAAYEICGLTLSPTAMRLLFTALSERSLEAVIAALEAHISDPDLCGRPPTAFDIIRRLDGCDATQAQIDRAWTRVDRGIRQVGPWRSITCDDPRVLRVIRDMGGWTRLCAHESEESLATAESEFKKRYAIDVEQQHAEPIASLPGWEELHNSADSYGRPRPIPLPG